MAPPTEQRLVEAGAARDRQVGEGAFVPETGGPAQAVGFVHWSEVLRGPDRCLARRSRRPPEKLSFGAAFAR